MLFANIYNSIISFLDADPATIGNILNTLYPNSTDVVGNITVSWNSTQIGNAAYYNSTFLNQFSGDIDGFVAFLLDVFGNIFTSYSIKPPQGYSELVSRVGELGDLTFDEVVDVIDIVLNYLFNQFLISAQTYLASCVIGNL